MLQTQTTPLAEIPPAPPPAPTPAPTPGLAVAAPLAPIRSRALRHLVDWWLAARGERRMPALGDVNPVEIPKALTRIWLCDVLPESGRIRYRLAGDEINDFWGFNLAGRYLDDIVPSERLASVTEKCRLAIELPAVVHIAGCLSLTDEIARNGERVILPLSDDGRRVNALLGATKRNWFRELEFDPFATYSETASVIAL